MDNSNKITSSVLGQLTQDLQLTEWWKSEPITVPYFDNKLLPVIFMDFEPEKDTEFIKEADKALTSFLQLSSSDKFTITSYVYENFRDFRNSIGENDVSKKLKNIKDENKIWKFVYPSAIHVSRRPYNDKDIYVQIACECEWEKEHGLQLVFRQGRKLIRVSDQDGWLTKADANGIPDEEDVLLSMFNQGEMIKPATNSTLPKAERSWWRKLFDCK
jgi:hypothetical protein